MLHFLKRKKGQALTEFAVAVPTMVIIILFSQFFYEAIQVRLKAQELARYTAYEFTGHALHDYDDGSFSYSDVSSGIESDAKTRFSNLKSSDKLSNATKALAGEWNVSTLTTKDLKEPLIPGGTMANTVLSIFGYILDGLRLVAIAQHPNIVYAATAAWYTYERNTTFGGGSMNVFNPPSEWKFNKKGYIRAETKVTFDNLFIPKKFMGKEIRLRKITFKEHHVVLADSWKLQYGDDITGTDSADKPYYKQVDRMAFIKPKVRKIFKTYFDIIKWTSNIISWVAFQPALTMNDLTETALVAKNYTDRNSGKIDIQEDSGKVSYDTLPLLGEAYEQSLSTRGEFYMACPEQESMGCTSSLSTDNPFGEYIIPEEAGH